MKEIDSLTSEQIMSKLQSAISEMQMAKTNDHWLALEVPGGVEEDIR